MPLKLLSKLFWSFLFLCLFLIQLGVDSPSNKITLVDNKSIEDPKTQQSYPLFYAAFQKVVNERDDSNKLIAISESLKIARAEGFSNKFILQQLNIIAARIHQSRWHVIYAIENYKVAQSFVYDKNVDNQIKKLRKYLATIGSERGLNDVYIATKYTGPAKTFRGKVMVAYVFVDEGIKTHWSNKTKLRTQQILKLVQNWQTEKAAEYNINDIEFINKTFVARKNPSLKRPKTVSFKSSRQDIKQFVTATAQSLGENSIGDFVEKQMQKIGADQGVVFLHTNLDQRSFAQRCGYTHESWVFKNGKLRPKMFSDCQDEYVILMEKVKHNQWDKLHYAQAHEMMHVFGAADLYNIKKANDYAVTDIMNYQSKLLLDSSVDPITAYAIGWQKKPPKAPFRILER